MILDAGILRSTVFVCCGEVMLISVQRDFFVPVKFFTLGVNTP